MMSDPESELGLGSTDAFFDCVSRILSSSTASSISMRSATCLIYMDRATRSFIAARDDLKKDVAVVLKSSGEVDDYFKKI